MEMIDYKMEIKKMKEGIRFYMQTELGPILELKKIFNIIVRDNLIAFQYKTPNKKLLYFSFSFHIYERGVDVSVKFFFDSTTIEIDANNKLDSIFIALNKEAKKYKFSQLYNK
jgi:hypothetical protein